MSTNKVVNYRTTYSTGSALKDAYETVKPGVQVVLFHGKSAKPWATLTGFPKHVEVAVPSTTTNDQSADDFSELVPAAEVTGWDFNESLNEWVGNFKYAKNLATVNKADGFERFTPTKPAAKKVPAKTTPRKVTAPKPAAKKPAAVKVVAKSTRTVISRKVNGKVVKPIAKQVTVEVVTLKKGDKFMRYGKTYNVAVKQRNGEVKVNGPAGFTTFANDTKVKVLATA
ncbi:MAG: hypothetical protein WBO55_10405 [Rhizobiaceae bacterium]